MKIALVTEWGSNYAQIGVHTIPTMQEYCLLHGYSYRPLHLGGTGNEYAYMKINYFDRILKEFDFIFYMDVDAKITNFGIKLESFISEGHDLWITEHAGELNGGVMLLRNSEWTERLIKTILFFQKDHDNEQNILEFLRKYKTMDRMKVLPHPSFNSLDYSQYPEFPNIRSKEQGHWEEGCFIIHTPGLGIEKRLEVLSQAKITR